MANVSPGSPPAEYLNVDDKIPRWNNQLWVDMFRALMVLVVFVPSAIVKPALPIVWFGYLPFLVLSAIFVFLSWKGRFSRVRLWILLVIDSIVINIFAYVIGVGIIPVGLAMIPVVLVYTTAAGKREGLVSYLLTLGLFGLILILQKAGILADAPFIEDSLPRFVSPGGPFGAWVIISGVLIIVFTWVSMVVKNLHEFNEQIVKAYDEEQRVLERSAKLSRAMRQTEKLEGFGKLAGGVAHDFNSLLMVIMGFTSEVLENNKGKVELEGDLLEVKKAADRAIDLTGKLLSFSRRQDVEAQPMEMNQLIRSFQQLLSPIIGEYISVSLNLHERPLWVNGDRKRIEQLLMALAINSKDAMPEGGKITIKTIKRYFKEGDTNKPPSLSPGDYVEVIFSDNGVGMSREVHSRAFEPFFTTKAQGEGSGLGLSVVYGIARQHDGEIRAESKEGMGTTIRLFLPAIPEWPGAYI